MRCDKCNGFELRMIVGIAKHRRTSQKRKTQVRNLRNELKETNYKLKQAKDVTKGAAQSMEQMTTGNLAHKRASLLTVLRYWANEV